MAGRNRIGILLENALPALLVGAGTTILATILVEIVILSEVGAGPLLTIDTVAVVITTGPFAVTITAGGWWLRRNDIEPADYPRIGYWIGGGLVVFLLINVLMILVWPADALRDNLAWARFAASVGATGGLFIGVIEARAIQRGRDVERISARAELAGEQRDVLEFANALLRHEVLNATQLIQGTALAISEDTDLDTTLTARVGTIHDRTERVTGVIEDVRVLLEATMGETEVVPVDLSAVLRDEIESIRSTYDTVEIDGEVPDDLTVLADHLVNRVFSNLFANAVEHNFSSPPRVEVTVDETPSAVTVRVVDNGPGIPQAKRATLFQVDHATRSDHGLGLFLVRQLLESYGGGITLVETGAAGTEFAVDLARPRASPDGTAAGAAVDRGGSIGANPDRGQRSMTT